MRYNHNSIVSRELYGDFSDTRVHDSDLLAGGVVDAGRVTVIAGIFPYPFDQLSEFIGIGINIAPHSGSGIIFFFNPDYCNGVAPRMVIVIAIIHWHPIIGKGLKNFRVPVVVSIAAHASTDNRQQQDACSGLQRSAG